jgi:putative glutamine amidotransferase
MRPRPIIGLTTHVPDENGHFHLDAKYVEAVRRAGGIAVLLPPGDELPQEVLARLDGVIFTGGGDVEPALYGAEGHEQNHGMNLERDRVEGDLIRAALAGEKPMLCICRGTQILNVAPGGTLHQHLPDVVGEEVLHRAPPRVPVQHVVPGRTKHSARRSFPRRAPHKYASPVRLTAFPGPAGAHRTGVCWLARRRYRRRSAYVLR